MTRVGPASGRLLLLAMILLVAAGCAARVGEQKRPAERKEVETAGSPGAKRTLVRLGHAIQAGAFRNVENAAMLAQTLQAGGLNATYLAGDSGIYRVQFGNFPSRQEAVMRAELLQALGVIEAFYIVTPDEYAVAGQRRYGDAYLREELITTARRFIGVPYLWGGASSAAGFDCSGLTLAVYQLNGLDLPRISQEQFEAGAPVAQGNLEKGDLVFFSTSGTGRISHVGVYDGEGRFIHAPGRGKHIRTDSLSQPYYRKHYRGARSYL